MCSRCVPFVNHSTAISGATDAAHKLRASAPPCAYGPAVFTQDDTALLVPCDAETEFRHLYRLDLASESLEPLTADIPWDVDSVYSSNEGNVVAIDVNAGGCSEVYLLAGHITATSRPVRVQGLPLGVVSGAVFDWHSRRLAVSMNIRSFFYVPLFVEL